TGVQTCALPILRETMSLLIFICNCMPPPLLSCTTYLTLTSPHYTPLSAFTFQLSALVLSTFNFLLPDHTTYPTSIPPRDPKQMLLTTCQYKSNHPGYLPLYPAFSFQL